MLELVIPTYFAIYHHLELIHLMPKPSNVVLQNSSITSTLRNINFLTSYHLGGCIHLSFPSTSFLLNITLFNIISSSTITCPISIGYVFHTFTHQVFPSLDVYSTSSLIQTSLINAGCLVGSVASLYNFLLIVTPSIPQLCISYVLNLLNRSSIFIIMYSCVL